jgi:uncharacterized membrane protein YagU involved in acid resistance
MWRRLPPEEQYPLPPREIVDRLTPVKARAAIPDREMEALALVAHSAFGAAAGALFPVLTRSRNVGSGAAYGVAVWMASYLGWIPAFGILKPATRHPPSRNLLMIAAHLVWGSSLALWLRATGSAPHTWVDRDDQRSSVGVMRTPKL